jgi:hypothetical protein
MPLFTYTTPACPIQSYIVTTTSGSIINPGVSFMNNPVVDSGSYYKLFPHDDNTDAPITFYI